MTDRYEICIDVMIHLDSLDPIRSALADEWPNQTRGVVSQFAQRLFQPRGSAFDYSAEFRLTGTWASATDATGYAARWIKDQPWAQLNVVGLSVTVEDRNA